MEKEEKGQPEAQKHNELCPPKQKSVFTTTSQIYQPPKPLFNPHAKPFQPSRYVINIGPSQLAVNAKVWQSIASNRTLPAIFPKAQQHQDPGLNTSFTTSTPTSSTAATSFLYPMPSTPPNTPLPVNLYLPHDAFDLSGFANNTPPAFDSDPNRRLVFRREFGPVATEQGFIDVRLRFGINVWLTLDRAVLVENGEVRIAVSADGKLCSLEHPNGRVRQIPERIDIVAFDGFQKNNFVRYAKMWKDSISLTARGCCLTYLVDPAGTRTTSDQVNREWKKDYCKEAFFEGYQMRSQAEVDYAAAHYNFKVEEDETETFTICGVRVSQTRDGMVRVTCNDRFSIRTSVENRSVTLSTANIYCTASMSDSPHLFVRHFERRIHFDGAHFIVRNMGHSASFDNQNLLRIH